MNTKISILLNLMLLFTFTSSYSMEPVDSKVRANQSVIDAAATGDLNKIQDALKEGADLDYVSAYQMDDNFPQGPAKTIALFQACRNGKFDVFKFLIESYKIKIDRPESLGLFYFFVLCEKYEMAEYLIKTGVDLVFPYFRFNSIDLSLDSFKFLIWHGVLSLENDDLRFRCEEHDIRSLIGNLLIKPMSSRKIRILVGENEWFFDRYMKEDLEDSKEKGSLIEKYALKVKNLKNKSFKNMVKKVNEFSLKQKQEIEQLRVLPTVLVDLVTDCSLYPETLEKFFELSDEQVDELLKVYKVVEKEEAEKASKKCLVM